MKVKLIAMAGGLMILATAAWALPPMAKVFDAAYKPAKNSALKKADCAVCHIAKGKTKLNPYGEDIKKELAGSKTLTADILKKVEALDSDKDGVSNLEEIKAGTLPGDPKSKPEKK
jgi:hypothetical protein